MQGTDRRYSGPYGPEEKKRARAALYLALFRAVRP
jgi:hypothetical protein